MIASQLPCPYIDNVIISSVLMSTVHYLAHVLGVCDTSSVLPGWLVHGIMIRMLTFGSSDVSASVLHLCPLALHPLYACLAGQDSSNLSCTSKQSCKAVQCCAWLLGGARLTAAVYSCNDKPCIISSAISRHACLALVRDSYCLRQLLSAPLQMWPRCTHDSVEENIMCMACSLHLFKVQPALRI